MTSLPVETKETKRTKKPKARFEERVVAVLKHIENKSNHIDIRICHWIVSEPTEELANGDWGWTVPKDTGAKLEKRRWLLNKQGERYKFSKLRGLTKEDIEYLVSNWDEIHVFFER